MSFSYFDRPNRIPWPPLILITACILSFLIERKLPLSFLFTGHIFIGFIITALGLLIDIVALNALKKGKTTFLPNKKTTHLITTGIFSYSRNPIYVANIILLIGLGFMLGSYWYFVAAVITFFLLRSFAVLREEKHLSEQFGDKYREYMKRTRRWL